MDFYKPWGTPAPPEYLALLTLSKFENERDAWEWAAYGYMLTAGEVCTKFSGFNAGLNSCNNEGITVV